MLSNSLNKTEMDQELYLKFQELQDRIEEELHEDILKFAQAMYEKGRQDESEYVAEMYADENY